MKHMKVAAGGPVNVVWGWVIVCFLILCVAISLAEITSVYPFLRRRTSHRSMMQRGDTTRATRRMFDSRHHLRSGSWSYVAGNITITLAVNFGTALLFVACLNIFEKSPGIHDATRRHHKGDKTNV
jgi:amino acid transporter